MPVKKNVGGRPPHAPTDKDRRTVEALAGFQIPQAKIADVIGITIPTLEKHYGEELRRGAAVVESKLVGNLLRLSNGSDGTALKATMFALQCRFGWSQYAPSPAEKREPPVGKKIAADMAAQHAHEDSEWGELLN